MPNRITANTECRRRNKARMVHQVGSFSIRRFWRDAYGSSYMIVGGTQMDREELILEKLHSLVTRDNLPVILLTTDSILMGRLIGWSQAQKGVSLIESSPQYRNYHFFYGMDDNSITACFLRLAQSRGYHDTAEMESYIRAFLEVIRSFYLPSLPAMIQLAKHNNYQVADLGVRKGLSPNIVSRLRNYAAAGMSFHNLLLSFNDRFSTLGGFDIDTRTNITTTAVRANAHSSNNVIHAVDLSTIDPVFVSQYFGAELYNMLTRSLSLHLLLDGVLLTENDMMCRAIDLARGNALCDFGISVGNPWLALRDDRYVNGYQCQLLLTGNGDLDNGDLARLLDRFGRYTHWEPVMVGPDHLFQLAHRDYSIQSMERNRIRLEDVRGKRAVLYGPWGHDAVIAGTLTK